MKQLNKRYSFVEELLNKDDEGVYYFRILETYLNSGIERLHRRIY